MRKEMMIRRAVQEDYGVLAEMLRYQYGATHEFMQLYRAEGWRSEIEEGILRTMVAGPPGAPFAMVSVRREPMYKGCLYYCLFVVHALHRSRGVGRALAKAAKVFEGPEYVSAYSHCLTFDNRSQRFEISTGYRPTGVILNNYPIDHDAHGFAGLRLPSRYTHLIMSKTLSKRETGRLYIPREVEDDVCAIYRELGVAISDADVKTSDHRDITDHPEYGYTEYMGALPDALPERSAYNLFLNLNDPGCLREYDRAKTRGFFYTGLQPLAADAEYLIMHRSESASEAIEAAVTIPQFSGHLNFIKELCDGSHL
jgi:GNAT superfamily N-acetyltransferase